MRVLFLHHQQRRPHTEEPSYNELFRPFIRAPQVRAWSEFVYQTPLRQLLLDELARRGKVLSSGSPTEFIAQNFDSTLYEEANVRLLPQLLELVAAETPDLIVYSMTWLTETIHPGTFAAIRAQFPNVKIFAAVWDHGEGGTFFHSYERALLSVVDFYASTDSQSRVRRVRERQPPYQDYEHVERVHWFPTLYDPQIYTAVPADHPQDLDVVILGSSEGYRHDVIRALAERYGSRFHHVGGYMASDVFVGLAEYVRVIHRAKIVVNTQTYSYRVQVKGRVREVLTCGAFLLEQDNPESREFLAGSGVVLFTDLSDLVAKIDYYVDRDAERRQIARRAHEWYRSRYTPESAVQRIMDAVGLG